MAKYCERCGSKLKKGYCPICDTDSYISSDERRFNFKRYDIIWFVVLAMILGASAICSSESPARDSIERFVWSHFNTTKKSPTKISNKTYRDVLYPLSKDGETFETTLNAGNYIVGKDIPEGIYTVSNLGNFGPFIVNDKTNKIYIQESLNVKGEESRYFSYYKENVQLYQGATLRVYTNSMQFKTTNGQTNKLEPLTKNTITSEYIVETTSLIGEVILPGTYDIIVIEGEGNVKTDNYDGINHEMSVDTTNRYAVQMYKNVILHEYDKLVLDDGLKIKLVPSENIREDS